LGLWAFVIEPKRLVVRQVTLELPRWPAPLHGMKVAAISDLHAGGWHMPESRLQTVVAEINAASPDLIVLLGDYVSSSKLRFIEPERLAEILHGLHAPLGVFAVLGNHDWWFDGPRVRKALEAQGIRVLDKESAQLAYKGTMFWLGGIADHMTQDSNPTLPLLRSGVPADAPLIFITHGPDVFPDVPPQAALTLAGHTHGGQVRLPFIGAPVVPSRFGQRFAAGHIVEDGRHLFVTTGLGTSILPLRFGIPPEIVLLTLN
jgi:predicted MPP superfamily phosphohydrolase